MVESFELYSSTKRAQCIHFISRRTRGPPHPSPQIKTVHLTLSQPGRVDYAHHNITTNLSDFQTILRPCILSSADNADWCRKTRTAVSQLSLLLKHHIIAVTFCLPPPPSYARWCRRRWWRARRAVAISAQPLTPTYTQVLRYELLLQSKPRYLRLCTKLTMYSY